MDQTSSVFKSQTEYAYGRCRATDIFHYFVWFARHFGGQQLTHRSSPSNSRDCEWCRMLWIGIRTRCTYSLFIRSSSSRGSTWEQQITSCFCFHKIQYLSVTFCNNRKANFTRSILDGFLSDICALWLQFGTSKHTSTYAALYSWQPGYIQLHCERCWPIDLLAFNHLCMWWLRCDTTAFSTWFAFPDPDIWFISHIYVWKWTLDFPFICRTEWNGLKSHNEKEKKTGIESKACESLNEFDWLVWIMFGIRTGSLRNSYTTQLSVGISNKKADASSTKWNGLTIENAWEISENECPKW